MTSKMVALKLLDRLFVAVSVVVLCTAIGLPTDWLLRLTGLPRPEFENFALFLIFAVLLLIHAIATSDSAP